MEKFYIIRDDLSYLVSRDSNVSRFSRNIKDAKRFDNIETCVRYGLGSCDIIEVLEYSGDGFRNVDYSEYVEIIRDELKKYD